MPSKFVMFFEDGEIKLGDYDDIRKHHPNSLWNALLNEFAEGKAFYMVIEEGVLEKHPMEKHILLRYVFCNKHRYTWFPLEEVYSLKRPDLEENLKIAKALFLITP